MQKSIGIKNHGPRGKDRRTLKDIEAYPTPKEIYAKILESPGWDYKSNMEFYRKRDRALIVLQYLLSLRISEELRLVRGQFEVMEDSIIVKGIKLSKSRLKNKPRKHQFREEAIIPLDDERQELTKLLVDYLEDPTFYDKNKNLLKDKPLFLFGPHRAWEITIAVLGIPDHWLRAYGEDFLYEFMHYDILALASYLKVEPRTLQEYIRKRWKKYFKNP